MALASESGTRTNRVMRQSASAVLMIRPHRFYPNPETAADNAFQQAVAAGELPAVSLAAQEEFDRAVETLRDAGVTVQVMDDTAAPEKPDAVFPNNWFSTHHDGRVALYPMASPTRQRERRADVIDALRADYRVTEVIDYSGEETEGRCLEGTGSMVLDHVHKIAYASLSQRTHAEVLRRFCADFGYEPVTFRSESAPGVPIYHTNVMMCVGSDFALVGLRNIPDEAERVGLQNLLEASAKEVIELAPAQIAEFAGNALELQATNEKLLVLSARALAALPSGQRRALERYVRFVPLALPTIELAGGSARCMLATIHLPPR
ncbi:MAG TPA: arginine deiminase-related protein [Chthoniobacterales bacterium]|nr:arginine deiminase-related protein [Chthoniobacterales bacterium]